MLGIIINPKSGKRAFRRQRFYLFQLLKQRNIPFEYKVTQYANHAAELARELVERGCDEILVLGGDGTLSEAINGIMKSKIQNKESIRFGILPRGTGNDWGRYWGIDKHYRRALDIFFSSGHAEAVDVGRVTYYRNNEPHYHYFINSVGFGIDAITVQRASVLKYYVGSHRFLYLVALLAAVWSHKPVSLNLKTDAGFSLSQPMFTMNIGNGPYSGGGIRQNPLANPTDGVFHAMFATPPSLRQVFQAVARLFSGRLLECDFIHSIVAQQYSLLTDEHLVFEADGILMHACGPFTVDVLPHALQMVVPMKH